MSLLIYSLEVLINYYLILIGLQVLELTPDIEADGKDFKFLGIFAKNREEWAVADIACIRNSITIVPFFDSLGAAAL